MYGTYFLDVHQSAVKPSLPLLVLVGSLFGQLPTHPTNLRASSICGGSSPSRQGSMSMGATMLKALCSLGFNISCRRSTSLEPAIGTTGRDGPKAKLCRCPEDVWVGKWTKLDGGSIQPPTSINLEGV